MDQPEGTVQHIPTLDPGARLVLDKRQEKRRRYRNTFLELSNGGAMNELLASLDFN